MIAKPTSTSGTWNPNQFIGQSSMKGGIMQAYNNYGWFGGYANLDFAADSNQFFVNEILGELRVQCIRYETCIC